MENQRFVGNNLVLILIVLEWQDYVTFYRHGANTNQHAVLDRNKAIPFEFKIKLPAPLKTGIDYGFRSSKMSSKKLA